MVGITNSKVNKVRILFSVRCCMGTNNYILSHKIKSVQQQLDCPRQSRLCFDFVNSCSNAYKLYIIALQPVK